MKRSTTMLRGLAALAASGLLLTACGGGNGGGAGGGDGQSSTLVDSTPAGSTKVTSITWGLPQGEPTSIDPMLAGGDSESTVVANFCESLLTVKPDFSLAPALATKADWTDDHTFVIDLRDDVTFWDGKPMTAQDVVASLQRSANPKLGGYFAQAFQYVTAIKVTGDHQVTLTFSQPDAQFRDTLAGGAGSVMEAAYTQQAGKNLGTPAGGLMCTGPYTFVSWKPGDSIVAEANDHYWNGTPKIGRITYRFVGDTSTLTTALKSGEIDGAYNFPVSTAVALKNSSSGTLWQGPSTASLSFGPTSDSGLGADPRIRTALDLAIDKKAVVRSIVRGFGTVQKTFTSPTAWQADVDATTYEKGYQALPSNAADLGKAKALVKQADATGKTLHMVIPAGNSELTQTATVVQAAAKAIGMKMTIRTLQPTEFSALFYDPGKRSGYDFVATTGYAEVPGALYYAPQFALKQGLFNWSGYDDAKVATLLNQARATRDPAVTATNFAQAQAIFGPARLQVTLAGTYNLLYLRKGLSGAPASIAYLSSPWALKLGGTR